MRCWRLLPVADVSDREVSIAAVGHESAIRSIKRGMDVRASTLLALCEGVGIGVLCRSATASSRLPGGSMALSHPPRASLVPAWVAQLTNDLRAEDPAARLRGTGSTARGAQCRGTVGGELRC